MTVDEFAFPTRHSLRMSKSSGRVVHTSRRGTSPSLFAELIQEVEHGRVGPMQVLDHEHGRSLRRFGGQEPGPRREGLFAVRAEPAFRLDQAEQWSQPGAQPAGLVLSRFDSLDAIGQLVRGLYAIVGPHDSRRRAHDLFEGRERDRFAVREAPASVPCVSGLFAVTCSCRSATSRVLPIPASRRRS